MSRPTRYFAVFGIWCAFLALASTAHADFNSVTEPFVSWRWAVAPDDGSGEPPTLGPTAVRADGSLIAAVANHSLHLIHRAGGSLDASTAFGPPDVSAYVMVMRKGLLYVAARDVKGCPIEVIDPNSGARIRTIHWEDCTWPAMAIDPLSDDIVLERLIKSACFPCIEDRHPIVAFNPDTGRINTLVSDSGVTATEAITLSPDGQTIFIADEPAGEIGNTYERAFINAYPRALAARPAYRIEVPSASSPDGMVFRGAAPCFGDSLIYADDFGTVYTVEHPGATSTASKVIATSPQASEFVHANVSQMSVDTHGYVVVSSNADAMVIACAGARSPVPPTPPPTKPPAAPAPVKPIVKAVAAEPRAPVPAGSSQAAAPQPPPAAPGGPGTAVQVVPHPGAAPVGAVADAPENEHAVELTASGLAGLPPGIPLAAGAIVLTGLAALAMVWLPDGRDRAATVTETVR